MGRLLVGEDVTRSRPIAEIGLIAPRPIMIIHSQGDRLIPVAHANDLAAAAAVTPWIIPGGGHVDTYAHDPAAYLARISTFFAASLR